MGSPSFSSKMMEGSSLSMTTEQSFRTSASSSQVLADSISIVPSFISLLELIGWGKSPLRPSVATSISRYSLALVLIIQLEVIFTCLSSFACQIIAGAVPTFTIQTEAVAYPKASRLCPQ